MNKLFAFENKSMTLPLAGLGQQELCPKTVHGLRSLLCQSTSVCVYHAFGMCFRVGMEWNHEWSFEHVSTSVISVSVEDLLVGWLVGVEVFSKLKS